VILAQGARHGGHALFVKDDKLWYANNFIGVPPEQQLVSTAPIGAGKHVLGVEFVKEGTGDNHESTGTAKLYIDDEVVAEGPLRTQAGHFALCGEGLAIGHDTGDPVSNEYPANFPFEGGRIVEVEVNIGDDVYLDVERDLAAAMARD
jgi:arylsulfatase